LVYFYYTILSNKRGAFHFLTAAVFYSGMRTFIKTVHCGFLPMWAFVFPTFEKLVRISSSQ
ncbi:hypothetical protein, partial [Ruminococcus callidus]|uniref:hypothetical protein n=1 Tax=Ruminococcus callidus TaxID=40519 RepID=UPI0023F7A981